MVTKEQALSEGMFHFGDCLSATGKNLPVRCRRNGNTQVWKRSPNRFRVPIKHGLYTYAEITENNAHLFHTEDECPLKGETK